MVGFEFLTADTRSNLGDLILICTAIGAVLTANRWSRRTVFGRWLHRMWIRNVSGPRDARRAEYVVEAVAPLIEAAKVAAKTQHDEQNHKFEVLSIGQDTLAAGQDAIKTEVTQLGRRLGAIEANTNTPKETP